MDDELIGISVIDILPYCISSVYFIWHPEWAWASLGKLSAMHEVALGLEMNNAGVENMKYLYMGTYPVEFHDVSKPLGLSRIRLLDRQLRQDEIQIGILAILPS